MYFGQRGYGLLEKGLGPVAIKIRIGRKAVGQRKGGVGLLRTRLFLAEIVKRLVDSNTVEPSTQLRPSTKVVQIAPSFQKSVLQHVVGILVGHDNAAYFPVERTTIRPDKCGKSTLPLGGVSQHLLYLRLARQRNH